jgi:hypothetical protein
MAKTPKTPPPKKAPTPRSPPRQIGAPARVLDKQAPKIGPIGPGGRPNPSPSGF